MSDEREIERALGGLEPPHGPAPGWEDKVWRRIAAPPAAPSTRLWLALGGAVAIAAAITLVVIARSGSTNEAELAAEVEPAAAQIDKLSSEIDAMIHEVRLARSEAQRVTAERALAAKVAELDALRQSLTMLKRAAKHGGSSAPKTTCDPSDPLCQPDPPQASAKPSCSPSDPLCGI